MTTDSPHQEPVVSAVFEKLGGRTALGVDIASDADLARAVAKRIPLKALYYVQKSEAFSDAELQHFIIPARTRRHREKRREPLSVEESDRLVRLTRIQALAEDVFGDPLKANLWLRERLGELGDSPPLELAQTEAGARVIEQLLARIDWGAAA